MYMDKGFTELTDADMAKLSGDPLGPVPEDDNIKTGKNKEIRIFGQHISVSSIKNLPKRTTNFYFICTFSH